MESEFKVKLYEWWHTRCLKTGIELEEEFGAIPPTKRLWYHRLYLWYRRNFWYILALGGVLLLALIVWDIANNDCNRCGTWVGGGQLGGDGETKESKMQYIARKASTNPFAMKTKQRAAQLKSGVKAAPAAAWKGIKAAPGAAYRGVGAAANKFKDSSGKIYRWLFTIFIFFAVGVFIMPTVAMIILGMLTFYIARGSLQRTVAI